MNADRDKPGASNHHAERELALRVAARRDALLGEWAAARLGLHGKAADDYVKGLLGRYVVHADPAPVVVRVLRDLLARGRPVSRGEINAQIVRFTAKARAEVVRHAMR